MTFHNPTGTTSHLQRSCPSPEAEQKAALLSWRNRGFNEGSTGVYRYTDSGVLAVAGKDALVMLKWGRRLGKEARERG